MTSIINKSLSSSIVPQCFKHILVKPLDPDCLKHYCPVSNSSFLFKGTGVYCPKTVFAAVSQPSSTYHSTETALLRVVNDLLQASDSGCVSILSLLDLSAAFDTTDHNILITRFRTTFGCSVTVLDWFISYKLQYPVCDCWS